jgi:hypothetical protein
MPQIEFGFTIPADQIDKLPWLTHDAQIGHRPQCRRSQWYDATPAGGQVHSLSPLTKGLGGGNCFGKGPCCATGPGGGKGLGIQHHL